MRLALESVVEVNDAAAETVFVHQLEIQAHIVRQGPIAASHDNGCEEDVVLINQSGLDRLGSQAAWLGPTPRVPFQDSTFAAAYAV
ncbi:MAG: hypothetical protein PVSMB1_15330 [Gemmatimonadaceae bacterium]